MKLTEIKTIAVIGAGTMGSGIAQMSAMAGYKTIIFDIQEAALDKAKSAITKNLDKGMEKGKVTPTQKDACLANISFISQLEHLKADVIIEAVVEKLQVKIDLFSQLEKFNSERSIFATNTSSIPITQIGSALKHPERLVGMHFFNPAHIMKLVEIISGVATDDEIALTTKQLAEKMGKKAVMAKDSPGFIVNRVARHFYVESLKIAEEGVADFQQIDNLMESCGFKMGPFRLMDLIGVDTNFSVTQSMFQSFHYDAKFRPSRIQQQKVDAGHHGRKSGKGFYEYK
jgi:3-hydroxybutyryl-CoA dehydrogenase